VTLGQTIKLLRKKRGWKQLYLAEQLGVSYETISSIERDRRIPRSHLLQRIASELDTTAEFLVQEDPRFSKPVKNKKAHDKSSLDPSEILTNLYLLRVEGKLSLEQIMIAALGISEK
jgi:transcriptional regulator with XRE-family HTH domain